MTNREGIRKLLDSAQINLTEALESLGEGDVFGAGLRAGQAEIHLMKLRRFSHVTNSTLEDDATS